VYSSGTSGIPTYYYDSHKTALKSVLIWNLAMRNKVKTSKFNALALTG